MIERLAWFALVAATISCADAGGAEPSSDESGGSAPNSSGVSGSADQAGSSSDNSGGSTLGGAGTSQGGSGGYVTAGTGGAAAGKGGAAGSGGAKPGGPAPPATWINATGNLAKWPPIASAWARRSHARLIAHHRRRRARRALLERRWRQKLATHGRRCGLREITNRVSSITFDREHPDVFWETGTHTGPGFYKTTDAGSTFKQLGALTFSQSTAIDFPDPQRKTLLVGTHGRGIFRSTDGGQTFTDISAGVTGNTLWPLLIDSQTYLIGTVGDNGAVFRTTDGGASWSQVSTLIPSHDGAFLRASDDSLYLPMQGNAGIMKSTDLGKTWTKLAGSGATFPTPFFSVTPIELPDRTLVVLGVDHLLRSGDGGASWKPIGEPFPFKLAPSDFGGVTYSMVSKTFFVWHADCGTAVLPDAIMSAGFDSL